MDGVVYQKLVEPSAEIAATLCRWENDPDLVPFTRRCRDREDLAREIVVTTEIIRERLKTHASYLIHWEGRLVGEVSFQVDPAICMRKVPGTAWIGITIGERAARHRGIGRDAMGYIENEIRLQGLRRIELGVFEFNENARRLYQKLGYREFARVEAFTYWDGRMWQDIRMEKDVAGTSAKGDATADAR